MLDQWYFLFFCIFLSVLTRVAACVAVSDFNLIYFLCNDREHLEEMEQRGLLENSEER